VQCATCWRQTRFRYLSLSEKIGRRCPYGTLGRECSKNGSAWIEPGGTASRRQLIWLAALAGREELIISSAIERVGRSSDAGQDRQSDEGGEDRLHDSSPICHSVANKWGLRLSFAVMYGTGPPSNGLRVAAITETIGLHSTMEPPSSLYSAPINSRGSEP